MKRASLTPKRKVEKFDPNVKEFLDAIGDLIAAKLVREYHKRQQAQGKQNGAG